MSCPRCGKSWSEHQLTGSAYVSRFLRGSANSVFPGEYLDVPVSQIYKDSQDGKIRARTAMKLFSREEYGKAKK